MTVRTALPVALPPVPTPATGTPAVVVGPGDAVVPVREVGR